jgi:lysophospholipase L1-like esterase
MTLMRMPIALLLAACLTVPVVAQSEKGWVATWATANMPLNPGQEPKMQLPTDVQEMTLRQVVHISQGGKRVRITFTNEFGTAPLHITAAHVAFLSAGSKILPETDRVLTFAGQPDVTIAPGEFVASDAVKETVPIYSDLVISMAVPAGGVAGVTYHSLARATTFLAEGDWTGAEEFHAPAAVPPGVSKPDVTAPLKASEKPVVSPAPTQESIPPSGPPPLLAERTSWYFLKDVEVNATLKSAAVVTFGDSITDGYNSTPETNRRYPDALAALLGATKKTDGLAVLNTAISGNRILRADTGPSALDRFDRDVLRQPGARYVIVLEGINDIGGTFTWDTTRKVTAADLIGAMTTLAKRAHAKGLRIFGGTLLPVGASGYDRPGVEEMRQQVNAFILSGNVFDGVVDFDKAVRDPEHPERMLTKYDSGDHLHPSDAGYAAMAAAVDLKLFHKKH